MKELLAEPGLLDKLYERIVVADSSCWVWTGGFKPSRHTQGGYGVIERKRYGGRRTYAVHRVVYALVHGPFDESLCVCHQCDVPLCINPAHLFLGTQLDNVRDCIEKGRFNTPILELAADQATRTHCPRGHPYAGENLRVHKNKRLCKACNTINARIARARRKTCRSHPVSGI